MVYGLRQLRNILLASLSLLLAGCEPFYDPVINEDVPTSPGSTWDKEPLDVKETTVNPFTVEDLSGDMTLSRLLDIALYNHPSTRMSWNAARASAYAYHAALSPYYPTIDYAGTLNAQTNSGTRFATSGSGIVATPGTAKAGTTSLTTATNNFSLTYLLLDFGGRNAQAELARQTLFASNWQHNYTMQQVMLAVLNAYTSYLGNRGLVIAYEQNLKDAEVALNAAQVMKTAGLATMTDVLLAQTTVEQTRTQLYQAQGLKRPPLPKF